MRIIGGKYRGKKIISPKDDNIRPTTDKARESLFNIIQSYVYDSDLLDLFAGTGAISIEAVSRGAKSVTLVEKSRSSLNNINSNIKLIDSEKDKIKVENKDVIAFLQGTNEKFDIIFLDPPYNYDKIDEVVKIISKNNILDENGVMVVETDKNISIKIPDNFYVEKEKIYSISKFTIIKAVKNN